MFSYASRLGLYARPFSRRMLFHTKHAGRLLQKASDAAATAATTKAPAEPPKKGIKALMSRYGYSALGVYLAFSALDLPIIFFLVHSAGTEKIEELENRVKSYFGFEVSEPPAATVTESVGGVVEAAQPVGWRQYVNPTLLTEFGIAYAIHKSLIFVRVPLTAATTPAVVRMLQRWGFNIGKKAAAAVPKV